MTQPEFWPSVFLDPPIKEPTFSMRILQQMKKLPYLGKWTFGENNLLCVDSLTWFRGVVPGTYKVWANECRGVLLSGNNAILVFPGA